MPLDINGYNNAFQGFVQFAENRVGLGLKGAAVKATKVGALCNLSIASARSTSWVSRTEADERDNDDARLLFRNAVIDMFGGNMKNVPKSVRKAMKLDLTRGTNYSRPGTEQNYLEPDEQTFRFTFPGEPAFACGADADAARVEEKVRRLCGEGHELQAQIVGANLSQAAAGPIKGALENFHVHKDEHSVLDYALSKDNRTGAITIRYSSPDGLPVRFSWTCTVDVDGTSTTTPLTVNR